MTPEFAQRILEERARRLAAVPPTPASPANTLELVIFTLGKERYALEARHVREVRRVPEFTPLPGAPAHLLGVINLRGHIVPLFGLHEFLRLPARQAADQARILVLGADDIDLAVLVDSVADVVRLPLEQLLEPPASLDGNLRPCLRGVTADALIVFEGRALLADPRLTLETTAPAPS